ncbi:CLUMA_CG012386, isoform A [Clunio marinus]|uniref:CLUMA_CG012386, isoform A n=1 Tax=Clunio marinus TaxID=568069 RepID=A0A1J1IFU5_9DIPT|nr:CLUMA_CG012386, isoform A [Clunio marinus]
MQKLQFWFFMATFLMNSMASVKLHCSYELYKGYFTVPVGTCRAQKFRTTFEDRNVSLVNNLYESFDIVQFYGEKQSCPYFPVNLGSHFPNSIVEWPEKQKKYFHYLWDSCEHQTE